MEKQQPKPITIQQLVDYLGNEIVKNKLSGSIIKGVGEVNINETMYQIQLHLEPDGGKWINESGIYKPQKKQSWLKRKILSLFTSTTDAETQK